MPVVTSGTGTYDSPDKQEHPINFIRWPQAQTYCEWSGKAAGAQRLCTEAEWEKAARGGCETEEEDCKTETRTYPWGENTPTCLLAWWGGCDGDTHPVEQLAAGVSPYGALNMAGNISEWVQDWYGSDYYCEGPTADTDSSEGWTYCNGKPAFQEPWINPAGPDTGTRRVLRGGSYLTTDDTFIRTAHRSSNFPTYPHSSIGIRCCRSIE